jgi:3-phosphoshikimate 1-carboxyvinyltransferase
MARLMIRAGKPLTGNCSVPGDKSISHRAVMFAGFAQGTSTVRGFLDGGDCRATVAVMRALGVQVDEKSATELVIEGRGLRGLQEPSNVLDCANSGTTIRLMTGLLAGQSFTSFLTGTEQIRRRPMGRIVRPLRGMGAEIIGRQDGNYAPLGVRPARLRGVEYEMPVASAQVKSSILLAGLYAQGLTVVREPGPARDHTERMLMSMGAPLTIVGRSVTSESLTSELSPLDIIVPGDMSSAAFLIVAASIVPDSHITINGVGVNPTRTGIVDALREMGAWIEYRNEREQAGEPVADIEVRYTGLKAAEFGGEGIVTLIDELPVLAVAASQAVGRTIVRDASELRVKETDRIATTVSELRKMGAKIEPTSDGFIIDGATTLKAAPTESHGDHRLAMAMAVAALAARGQTVVHEAEVTADSFPGFEFTLQALGADISETDDR